MILLFHVELCIFYEAACKRISGIVFMFVKNWALTPKQLFKVVDYMHLGLMY